jgi:hypothetical protein
MRVTHFAALVAALAIAAGVWLWYSHSGAGSEAEEVVQALTSQVGRAEGTAATARAQAAATAMEGFAAVNGGYAGATPELLRGIDPTLDASVAVASATDQGYCVQAGLGDSAAHVTGPGGLAEAGPCPA